LNVNPFHNLLIPHRFLELQLTGKTYQFRYRLLEKATPAVFTAGGVFRPASLNKDELSRREGGNVQGNFFPVGAWDTNTAGETAAHAAVGLLSNHESFGGGPAVLFQFAARAVAHYIW
jgi:hypothetical protein